MVIDWECASKTKKDKPLNARDTLYTLYKDEEKHIIPIIKKFGI